MMRDSDAKFYDEYYFKHGCGNAYERTPVWLEHFGRVAEKIVREINPRTVLDAGCALGFLVEALRQRGVEAFGIDISEYAISKVLPELQAYCRLGSVTDPLPQKYDLIVCIEILEHLMPRDAERVVENFCQHSDDVLFSSTAVDYKEATHFNVQPPEYWAELFAHHGFFRDVDFDASVVLPWAARFRRRKDPVARVARDYERKFWLLWKENLDLRELTVTMRNQLAADEQTIHIREQTIQARDQTIAIRDQEIQSLREQITEILNSHSWRFMRQVQRVRLWLAPRGSQRERWARNVLHAFGRDSNGK
jgi:SAM-dependent methyltransferase